MMRHAWMILPALMSLAACVEKDKVPSGAEDFATFCSACLLYTSPSPRD